MTKEEILRKVKFGVSASAGVMVLKNGYIVNFGAIRIEDDNFIIYTGMGLSEKAHENNDLTEDELIKSNHIAKIPISEIDYIR